MAMSPRECDTLASQFNAVDLTAANGFEKLIDEEFKRRPVVDFRNTIRIVNRGNGCWSPEGKVNKTNVARILNARFKDAGWERFEVDFDRRMWGMQLTFRRPAEVLNGGYVSTADTYSQPDPGHP